jgi:hypothetical protein
MAVQRIWILGVVLSIGICDAGPSRGYLPVAGPTVLRLQLTRGGLSAGALGPLAMKTPRPVEAGRVAGEQEAMEVGEETEDWVAQSEAEVPGVFGNARRARAVNPYDNGITSPVEGGWWHLLVTNKAGIMSVPVPSVGFTPPTVVAPSSRATYQTTP